MSPYVFVEPMFLYVIDYSLAYRFFFFPFFADTAQPKTYSFHFESFRLFEKLPETKWRHENLIFFFNVFGLQTSLFGFPLRLLNYESAVQCSAHGIGV